MFARLLLSIIAALYLTLVADIPASTSFAAVTAEPTSISKVAGANRFFVEYRCGGDSRWRLAGPYNNDDAYRYADSLTKRGCRAYVVTR